MSLNGLFLSFSALCDFLKNTFFEKKRFSKIFFEKKFFQMFPIVVLWIFLSLRYGADLRRSRLVYSIRSRWSLHAGSHFFTNILKSKLFLRVSTFYKTVWIKNRFQGCFVLWVFFIIFFFQKVLPLVYLIILNKKASSSLKGSLQFFGFFWCFKWVQKHKRFLR